MEAFRHSNDMISSHLRWSTADDIILMAKGLHVLPTFNEERRKHYRVNFNIFDSTGKRPLGRPRRRWKGNIRLDFKEIGVNTRDWVDLAQDKKYWRDVVNAALNPRVL